VMCSFIWKHFYNSFHTQTANQTAFIASQFNHYDECNVFAKKQNLFTLFISAYQERRHLMNYTRVKKNSKH